MAGFRLYRTAQEELEDIWFYTFRKWGERQADRYLSKIYDCLQELATKERYWRKLPRELCVPPDVKHEIYFARLERHYIFFRELKNNDVGIISILHDAMDIPVRLAEDLERIK